MRYVRLGDSGLQVSALVLGCMTFGDPARGTHPWSLPEEDSRAVLRHAWEQGVTTFDTANVYSLGSSEEYLGRFLAEVGRDRAVVATKVHGAMGDGPYDRGLSRKAVLAAADASLRRLGTDYIDLYQVHRWDPHVPVEETLDALDSLVRAGKVRYLGASSMWTWQFATALFAADRHGWHRFVSMQDHYNLLDREEEREMHPFCLSQGVGLLPWSPLARGRLARPWDERTLRSDTDTFGQGLYGQEADRGIVEAVGRVAEELGTSRATVATAWVAGRPGVSAPIVGARTIGHLDAGLAAVDLTLDDEHRAILQDAYRPRWPSGFGPRPAQ